MSFVSFINQTFVSFVSFLLKHGIWPQTPPTTLELANLPKMRSNVGITINLTINNNHNDKYETKMWNIIIREAILYIKKKWRHHPPAPRPPFMKSLSILSNFWAERNMTLSGQIDQISPPPFVKLAREAFKKRIKVWKIWNLS